MEQTQQLTEVQEYFISNLSSYNQLADEEIKDTFVNSEWKMYSMSGGDGESAVFHEETLEGDFLNILVNENNSWSVSDGKLLAYISDGYYVYHIQDNYYLLISAKQNDTYIIAEKVN